MNGHVHYRAEDFLGASTISVGLGTLVHPPGTPRSCLGVECQAHDIEIHLYCLLLLSWWFALWFCLEAGSHVAQASFQLSVCLEFMTLLPLLPEAGMKDVCAACLD